MIRHPGPNDDNATLVGIWLDANEELERLSEIRGRVEWFLQRRMEDDGATVYETGTHKVELKASVRYDQGRLTPILELLAQDELTDARAYEPEHEETHTVPAKWNMTKLKPFARYGKAIADIIEDAKLQGPSRVAIKEKP